MQTVKVKFPDGVVRDVPVQHWIERSLGRPMSGPAPVIREPDWYRTLPGYDVRGVLEAGFDYIAIQR